jgi:lipopolysaccharide heptosyltransferase I
MTQPGTHEGGPPPMGPVLVVRLGAIGDVIRALPAVDLLRKAHPGIAVDWVVEELSSSILAGHPHLRRVIVFPRKEISRLARSLRLPSAWGLLRATLGALREGGYESVVDLQGSLKSGLLTRATGCPNRIGLAAGHAREGAHRFYTTLIDPGPQRISRVERNFRLLSPLGIAEPEAPAAGIRPGETERAWAEGMLSSLAPEEGPRALLWPGTSSKQWYKRWPAERFGWLAGRLQDDGVQVLVAGGPGEEEMVEEVIRAAPTKPTRMPPSTLLQLAAVLEKIDLFVGGDTGPMHLSWAMGAPVVGLFGATDPVINAPYDPQARGHRVIYHGPQERPYRVKGERARQWMEAIPLDEVHVACREMLAARREEQA